MKKRRNNPVLHRLANRRYRASHLESVRARDRKFHMAHREHRNKQRRAWDANNPERRAQQQRRNYLRHRKKRITQSMLWAAANRESHLRSQRKERHRNVQTLSDRYLREICKGVSTPSRMRAARNRLLAKRSRRVLMMMDAAAKLGRIRSESNRNTIQVKKNGVCTRKLKRCRLTKMC